MRILRIKIFIIIIVFSGVFLFLKKGNDYTFYLDFALLNKNKQEKLDIERQEEELISEGVQEIEKEDVLNNDERSDLINQEVLFSSQAPFGEWGDPRFQDACEEVSALMAVYWAEDKILSPEIVKEKIIELADFQTKNHGNYIDTSAQDTVDIIFKEFFSYNKVEIVYDFDKQDMIDILENNQLIIVPTNGQALGNPNFTAPGPERHSLVIRGYDFTTKEFVTNDPGTRKGENYRYDEDILFAAIQDYPSGDHEPILENKKAMIVVSK